MSFIKLELAEDKICHVILNRSDKLNAINRQMVDELSAICEAIENQVKQKKIRVCIFSSSTPKAFCAGADLSERMKADENEVSIILHRQRKMMSAVETLSIPTISAIEGIALGGGLELSLCTDMRIAHPTAQLGLPEGRLAIIPGAGGTQRLARLVGIAKAKELIFRAARLTASEALTIGLVNQISDRPLELARQWAHEMLEIGPLAHLAAKRAVDRAMDFDDLQKGLDWERSCYDQVLYSKDRLEGLIAFSEKRKPNYSGE